MTSTTPSVTSMTSEVSVNSKDELSAAIHLFEHEWRQKYLSRPHWCQICGKFISGVTLIQQNAMKCGFCKLVGHADCCRKFEQICKKEPQQILDSDDFSIKVLYFVSI